MSASYLGTFPVKREISRNVDADGIVSASLLITDQEANIIASSPALDSEYELDVSLRVSQVEISYLQNGLAQAVVLAQGAPAEVFARVQVSVGGPLIYGLAPGVGSLEGFPNFSPTNGQVVEVTFAAVRGTENDIYAEFYAQVMPESIRGTSLPRAARAPGPMEEPSSSTPLPPSIPGAPPALPINNTDGLTSGFYSGFRCGHVSFEPAGGASRVRLYYRESGWLIRSGRVVFEV